MLSSHLLTPQCLFRFGQKAHTKTTILPVEKSQHLFVEANHHELQDPPALWTHCEHGGGCLDNQTILTRIWYSLLSRNQLPSFASQKLGVPHPRRNHSQSATNRFSCRVTHWPQRHRPAMPLHVCNTIPSLHRKVHSDNVSAYLYIYIR